MGANGNIMDFIEHIQAQETLIGRFKGFARTVEWKGRDSKGQEKCIICPGYKTEPEIKFIGVDQPVGHTDNCPYDDNHYVGRNLKKENNHGEN